MVVVDSSVLIPLLRTGRISLLQKFFKRITITRDVYEEIVQGKLGFYEFEKACNVWIVIEEFRGVKEKKEPFEEDMLKKADRSLLLLAKRKKDILLSNDAAIIMIARSMNIECFWMTTFLLECLKKKILTRSEAKASLFELVQAGMRLENAVYAAILKEMEDL